MALGQRALYADGNYYSPPMIFFVHNCRPRHHDVYDIIVL